MPECFDEPPLPWRIMWWEMLATLYKAHAEAVWRTVVGVKMSEVKLAAWRTPSAAGSTADTSRREPCDDYQTRRDEAETRYDFYFIVLLIPSQIPSS